MPALDLMTNSRRPDGHGDRETADLSVWAAAVRLRDKPAAREGSADEVRTAELHQGGDGRGTPATRDAPRCRRGPGAPRRDRLGPSAAGRVGDDRQARVAQSALD